MILSDVCGDGDGDGISGCVTGGGNGDCEKPFFFVCLVDMASGQPPNNEAMFP